MVCGLSDRRNDVDVGAAAAEISAHTFTDLLIGQFHRNCAWAWACASADGRDEAGLSRGGFLQHAHRRTHLTGSAIPALETVFLQKGFLHGVQFLSAAQSLGRGHLSTFLCDSEH